MLFTNVNLGVGLRLQSPTSRHILISFANYAITLALGEFMFAIPVSNFAIFRSQHPRF